MVEYTSISEISKSIKHVSPSIHRVLQNIYTKPPIRIHRKGVTLLTTPTIETMVAIATRTHPSSVPIRPYTGDRPMISPAKILQALLPVTTPIRKVLQHIYTPLPSPRQTHYIRGGSKKPTAPRSTNYLGEKYPAWIMNPEETFPTIPQSVIPPIPPVISNALVSWLTDNPFATYLDNITPDVPIKSPHQEEINPFAVYQEQIRLTPQPTPRLTPQPTPRLTPQPTPGLIPQPTPRLIPQPTPRVSRISLGTPVGPLYLTNSEYMRALGRSYTQ